ncbi:MAG: YfhO family protein, partial [Butyrivibrio sp.]|nr:YfhO family protein [Butyrivibrio sp.]
MNSHSTREKYTECLRTLLLFTVIYAGLMGLILLFFRLQGRSMVYMGDGWRQHLRALTYYGKYLRGVLYHIFVEHSLTVQNLAPDIGYGSDVLTTLQYYCLGDPLAALSVFVPASGSMALYEALIVLRPYLAGLAFCFYAFTRSVRRTGCVLTGAVIYAFSGTVLYIGFLHPYFVNPMIYYPLLIGCVEIAISRGERDTSQRPLARFVPFALAVAVSALCNFYFFYMLAIFTAAYGAARLLQYHGAASKRGCQLVTAVCKDVGAFLCAAFIGVLTAGVTLIPVLVQFVHDPRAGISFAWHAFYEASYYRELPRNLVTWINHPQYDTELCFTVVFVALCLVLLLLRGSSSHRTLKLCLAAVTLLLLFPVGGIMLNGFSYMINRWTWAAAMLAGWICVRGLEELEALLSARSQGARRASVLLSVLVPLLAILCVAWNIVSAFSPAKGAFPGEFREAMDGEAYLAAAGDNETSAVASYTDTIAQEPDLFRYSGRNLTWNAAMGRGLSSTQFEFSFANGAVSDYYQMIGVNEEQNFAYFALDDRMIASSVAGVRYYTLAYDNYYEYRFVPYSFQDRGMIGTTHLYENPCALSPGYPMASFMRRSAWEELSLTEREELLACAAVLEDADADRYGSTAGLHELTTEEARERLAGKELSYTITCGDGVRLKKNRFIAKGEDRTVTLTFEGAAGCETLLEITGLTVDGKESLYIIPIRVYTSEETEPYLEKTLSYKTPEIQYYSDWHNYVINFGCTGAPKTSITIEFPANGKYSFDHLAVVSRPMDGIGSQLAQKAAARIPAVDMHENPVSHATAEITCTASASEDALMVFTLPYTRGYTIYVDGERAPLLKTDAMFLSTPVQAGTHDIRITYRTPGLAAGLICSLLGILILVFMTIPIRCLPRDM